MSAYIVLHRWCFPNAFLLPAILNMEQGYAAKGLASRKVVARGERNLLQRPVYGIVVYNAVCEQRLRPLVDTWNLGFRQGKMPAHVVMWCRALSREMLTNRAPVQGQVADT